MPQFTVRVELHGADASHYERLHGGMEALGFHRWIEGIDESGNRGKWQLPTGEYDGTVSMTAKEVRDSVRLIASAVKPGAWVLVTQVAARSWNTRKLQA